MCGRVAIYSPPKHIAKYLDALLAGDLDPDRKPSWNIGPQRTLFGLTLNEGERVLDKYRWGLVPSWAKDSSIANKLFNARGETVAEKPSFRSAFAKRPCVVPVDLFYEWDHRPGHDKQPNVFKRTDGELLLLAGLHESWRDPSLPDDAPRLHTCTIITTEPNVDMDDIHNRMPVVLERNDVDTWIDVLQYEVGERANLLRPAPEGTLTHYEVNKAVGSVRNDGPELIEPVEPTSIF